MYKFKKENQSKKGGNTWIIQQDYQNQQYQQINFINNFNSKDIFKDISSLDALTEYAITALTEKTPSYFHEYEKTFTKQIRDYGVGLIQDCKDGTLEELSDEAIEEAIENKIGDALDASCILNHEYFKAGIQFGELMMMQLLF